MKKLSKADEAQRNELLDTLYKEGQNLIAATAEFNTVVNRYNEVLADIRGFADDVVRQMEAYVDERSEKWQESDAAEVYDEWKLSWQEIANDSLEDVEEIVLELDDHYSKFAEAPSEPE